jgi:pimeloyl-ACP methyl ester carboxylesterase
MDLPIILLHGALGAQDQLIPLAERLQTEREVHTLNFAGHGGQPFVGGGYEMKGFAEDLRSYMEEQGIEKADIFGYSMGGYVALTLAMELPEQIGKIFTLATKFDWNPESAAKEVKFLDPDVLEAKVPHFAEVLEKRHAPLDWKEVLGNTSQLMISLGAGAAHKPEDWAKVQNAVCLTVGSADNMVSAEETKALKEALPNAEYKVYEGVKHPIEKVDLDFLAKEILSFLA